MPRVLPDMNSGDPNGAESAALVRPNRVLRRLLWSSSWKSVAQLTCATRTRPK